MVPRAPLFWLPAAVAAVCVPPWPAGFMLRHVSNWYAGALCAAALSALVVYAIARWQRARRWEAAAFAALAVPVGIFVSFFGALGVS